MPFYYGWIVVAVAFVTLAVGVNVRTGFSLLYPPLLQEFGWDRGVTAAAFSIGFLVATVYAPIIGILFDRYGPRVVISGGAVMSSAGLASATVMTEPWHLYVSLGMLVVGGSTAMAYIGHSVFLPNWFVARRGLAVGIAFSGVGVGSILMFPSMQWIIDQHGWRLACWGLVVILLTVVVPLNIIFQRKRPQEVGQHPDGIDPDALDASGNRREPLDTIVDAEWAATTWTLSRAVRTRRFWLLFVGFSTAMFAWYTVVVHQTQYIIDQGFSASQAALALGLVPLFGVVAQIGFGSLSDKIGREWGYSIGCLGFVVCYGALLMMQADPGSGSAWLALVILSQGLLGYSLTPNYGAIPAEIFQGRHFGAIFGFLNVGAAFGAAAGSWLTGWIHDVSGSYTVAFWMSGGFAIVSLLCIWAAAPRKVRLVVGQARRRATRTKAAQSNTTDKTNRPTSSEPAAPTGAANKSSRQS